MMAESPGMPLALLPLVSVAVCAALAWLVLARARREPVHWVFAVSLGALALTGLGNGISVLAHDPEQNLWGRRLAVVGEMLMPLGWLAFTLSLVRSAVQETVREWRGG